MANIIKYKLLEKAYLKLIMKATNELYEINLF